jgi:hypothetical protein
MSREYEIRVLLPHEFPQWDEFVGQSLQGTLFHTTLWLKAGGVPFRLFGCFRGAELHGGFAAGHIGDGLIGHPSVLTPYLGILYCRPTEKYVTRISFEKEIAGAFASYLKGEFDFIQFRFPPEVLDLQPFIWEGFDAGVRYTYRLSLSSLDTVLTNMDSRRRWDLTKAERLGIKIEKNVSFERVLRLCELTFRRQRQKVLFSPIAKRIESELRNAGRCSGFLARGSDGAELGAVWIVWDEKRAYYLLGGYDDSAKSSSAIAFALWHAIQFVALELGLPEFDFEGSMVAPIEQFFRKFGGVLMPTFTITYHKPVSLVRRVARKVARVVRKSRSNSQERDRHRPLAMSKINQRIRCAD